MDKQHLVKLFRYMALARRIDQAEHEITSRGEAFFHLSGAGHEATVGLSDHLAPCDWLHPHYRSRAFLLAMGVPVREFFDSLFCKAESSSQGRRMSAFFCHRQRNLLSMVTPVGNNALQSVGVATTIKHQSERPIVLCGLGDGTTQQGEFMEACGEAYRESLPVLFLVEDNHWAISTQTKRKTFYSTDQKSDSFHGIPIHRVDGRDVVQVHQDFGPIVQQMRSTRQPAIVVLDVERLSSHTNADNQALYRSREDLEHAAQNGDPLKRCEAALRSLGVTDQEIQSIYEWAAHEVASAEARSFAGPEPVAAFDAKKSLPVELTHPSREFRGEDTDTKLTMRDAMREVLRHRLQNDSRVTLFGEDIEDPKGDVFGVTSGLSTQFPGRVKNSPLSESTILGVSIGQSLAGQRPVAFIQFADFLPLANNQITSELATMYWRTAGQWECPVIVMAACGAYRPGLGPFHAQTGEAWMAHTPGLDVFMPSTAADAAGMLNAAFESGRPTLFLYPKACLNDPKNVTSADVAKQFVPVGPARRVRGGRDITFVAWGNTVKVCEQTAEALERVGVESEILDLRSLSPWDERTVIASAEKTARLVVVHEDNHTCGIGAEVVATVAEKTRVPVAARRVTRPDTHVPCNFANQLELLPSFERVLATAADLLDMDLEWEQTEQPEDDGLASIDAVGSGPADETIILVEWMVKEGDHIQRGDVVASVEATKSVFELTSTVSGQIESLVVPEGETVNVGSPIARVKPSEQRPIRAAQDHSTTPVLSRRRNTDRLRVPHRTSDIRQFDVGISTVATVEGSRLINNQHVVASTKGRTADDILRRTGIQTRRWANSQEDAIGMAVKASERVLQQ
ncbi:MAG: hypothetical protein KDA87_15010, partial [Planctomycetales bacterium]|nr:hypothetical protein [Planctomycetales bacterium]